MAANRVIKTCCIAGFFLAEIYMCLVMLAPNRPAATPITRPFVALSTIPKSDLPLGTPPPTSVKVTRLLVGAFFFGPFGAMAGLGVGLLISALIPQKKPDVMKERR